MYSWLHSWLHSVLLSTSAPSAVQPAMQPATRPGSKPVSHATASQPAGASHVERASEPGSQPVSQPGSGPAANQHQPASARRPGSPRQPARASSQLASQPANRVVLLDVALLYESPAETRLTVYRRSQHRNRLDASCSDAPTTALSFNSGGGPLWLHGSMPTGLLGTGCWLSLPTG